MNRREILRGLAGAAGVMTVLRAPLAASAFTTNNWAAMMPNFALPPQDKAKAAAPKSGFDVEPVKLTKITEQIYLLTGPGGNIAVLPSKEGVLIIDDGVPGRAKDIADGVATVAQPSITTLINTHWHGDHTGGNEYLGNAGARIIAHDNVRNRLASDQFIEFFNSKVPAHAKSALPVTTFTDQATIYHGDETLKMTGVAPAHTDGDIFIHFQSANVLHAGDLFFNGIYPFIDYSTKGWIGGMVAAADKILSTVDAQTKIIPGHGPVATRDDLKASRDMMAAIGDRVSASIKAGKTWEETVASNPTKDFDAKFGKGFFGPDKFTELVYKGIVAHSKNG